MRYSYCRGDWMFTKVRLKNFRSFDNIEFDLTGRGGVPKHLAIIYGENGAGKSNLMSAFVLLSELLKTMNVRDTYEKLLNRKSIFNDESLEQALRQSLMSGLRDIQAIISDYSMIGSDGNIVAEYEFSIGGSTGIYSIELGEREIIHERLEYLLNRRRGIYFDCTKDSLSINSAIVLDKDFFADIKAAAKRFWGEHSILAIILHEVRDKSRTFAQENISENFYDVIAEFKMLSCYLGIGSRRWNRIVAPFQILKDPIDGEISKQKERQLDLAEKIFGSFFSGLDSNIKGVNYKRSYTDQKIDYQLFFEKFVAGSYRSIPFTKESTGNHQLLRVLCYILCACLGGTVIIDEADSGIHDVLFQKMIRGIWKQINGQLIITTHNTMLMEADLPRDSIYVISEDAPGSKIIRCISDYEKRTYIGNNIRNKYLNSEYGGLPEGKSIDFSVLLDLISKELGE